MTSGVLRAILYNWLVTLLFLGGCAEQTPEPFDPERGRGGIDSSLPPEQRAKQDALARLLEAFRRGIHAEDLGRDEPDLVFQEPEEQFYAEGARLWNWDWASPPRGDRFAVKLTMQKDEPGLVTVDVERTYQVVRQGSTFVISGSQK